MTVPYQGTVAEAMARLRRAGWRPVSLTFAGGKALDAAEKGGFLVVFDPDGGYATPPIAQDPFGYPYPPIPTNHPFRAEALDALCDSGPGGCLDFSAKKGD